ncbi:MAG: hypothetical protein HZB61_10175 [Nitrospirae bacterium]|nr:hypothetical protein [Nitrospirota bacterium]
MNNLNNIMTGDGISPIFTKAELALLEKKMNASDQPYWAKAYSFVHAYKRGAEPWSLMTKKQRLWLWKIKDSLG